MIATVCICITSILRLMVNDKNICSQNIGRLDIGTPIVRLEIFVSIWVLASCVWALMILLCVLVNWW